MEAVPKKPKHFVREWRKFRGLTMEQLADMVGASVAVVSRIERGEQRYNQEIIEAIANALRCTPGDLIMRDPTLNLTEKLSGLTESQAATVSAVIDAFRAKSEPPTPEAPKHDYDAEEAVVGAALYDEGFAHRIVKSMGSAGFYDSTLEKIYRAIEDMVREGEVIDLVTVDQKMRRYSALREYETRGGLAYLAELVDRAQPSKAPEAAARIVALSFLRMYEGIYPEKRGGH